MVKIDYPNKKSEQEILKATDGIGKYDLDERLPLLLFGDNLRALSLLLENGYRAKVDLIYIDPPYNTNQIFKVTSKRTNTISRSTTGELAYSDEFVFEEYLEFIRERLILLRELLSERGSIYVHIDSKMGHYLKIIMDEVFGRDNFKNDIARVKSNPKNFSRKAYGNEKDIVLFYAKDAKKNIFNQITLPLSEEEKSIMFHKVDEHGRRYNTVPVHAPGETTNGETGKAWRDMMPPLGRHWRSTPSELENLDRQGLIEWSKNGVPRIKKYADEHKGKKIQDVWRYKDPIHPKYPTEKNAEMLEMLIMQSSYSDSIILDCFAGSGSTLLAAQKLQRRWIGVDVSPVSMKIIRDGLGLMPYQYIDLDQIDAV